VKGIDRRTSLLNFVLDQLLQGSSSVGTLSAQLSSVAPAANLQVPSLEYISASFKHCCYVLKYMQVPFNLPPAATCMHPFKQGVEGVDAAFQAAHDVSANTYGNLPAVCTFMDLGAQVSRLYHILAPSISKCHWS